MAMAFCTQPANSQSLITKEKITAVKKAVVNFQYLSYLEKLMPPKPPSMSFIPNEEEAPPEKYEPLAPDNSPAPASANRITVTSPSAVLNYEGATDEAQVGSGFYSIPPDTYGAVGLDKVFTQLNNNYRILNKTTGAEISKVSIETFWDALGADGDNVFDPRVTYDPYNNRWIVAAASNGGSAASRILLGISQTHDPTGNYDLYSIDPDTGTTDWADFPMLGFNKNWVALAVNMFPVTTGSPANRFYAIDYPALLGGSASGIVFTGTGFCAHPAETYSATEGNLYVPIHNSSAGAKYYLYTVTGTPGSPSISLSAQKTRTGGGWTQVSGDIGPQTCVSGTYSCPGTLSKFNLGDSYIRNNVVFRNNAIWYTQAVGLPAGGSITHTAAQWTKIDVNGDFLDGGRIEDPTANATSGSWYSYPSIAVNANNDVVVGFSKMDGTGYASAGYAMRLGTDAAGTMQDPVIYKNGVDYYEKKFGGTRNRWGDYSHTMVDPVEDVSFWTVQEYAKLRAAPSVGGSVSKWGTWWAKVAPNPCNSTVSSGNWNNASTWGCAGVPNATKDVSIISGQNVTLNVNPLAASITVNKGGTLTVNSARTLSCKLIVYGTLNITGGKLTLGSNDVFIASDATLTGGSSSSFLVTNGTGKVSKIIPKGSSFEFPLSANGTSYSGLVIAIPGSDPEEVFSVRVEDGLNPTTGGANYCVQKTWTINEMKSGGNNATLSFKWIAADQGSNFSPAIPPYAFRYNGTKYVLASSMTTPVLNSGVYTSTTTGTISTFSPWILSSTLTLPITLHYFTGEKLSNRSHLLRWKAACSGASADFEIERSNDSRQFESIYSTSADFIRCQQPFDFTDYNPLDGKNFYRLKMTDEHGAVKYSNIVLLLNSASGFELAGLQPNPVHNLATLNISLAKKQLLQLYIIDAKGTRLYQKNIAAQSGFISEQINTEHLAQGVYTIVVVAESGERKTIRFVKQ